MTVHWCNFLKPKQTKYPFSRALRILENFAENASISGVEIKEGKLQIDSGCYFSVDDYTIGLLCGEGKPDISADISYATVGENPRSIRIKVDEDGMVTLVFRTE